MKVVTSAAEAESAFASAAREAQAYFGRSECYMERYLTRPRHVELQIFTDTHGNGVYISDRDCSAQRRHQKLIEEAPAPAIPEETRRAMGEAGVKVALGCGYVNAGTVEMLFQDGDFFFLEMNTRLQVEHCVTEEITGLDLVAEQIRVASGEPLSFTQESIERRGHSIECRINAEDPAKNFLPSPGSITRLRVPTGPGVRWDGGYNDGDAISQYYDNLIGKLIVWAPDRDRAIDRMLRALGEFEIEGVRTTIPAHKVLLDHPDFRAVRHSTKWVEEEVDASQFGTPVAAGASAPAAEGADEALVERTVPVEVDGRRFSVRVWLPDVPVVAAGRTTPGARTRPKLTASSSGGGAGDGTVTAPMQGTIVQVLVEVGAQVEVGQAILVLEAMKMENHINAERAGEVQEIRVRAGDSVGTGDILAVIG
jgi:acetyl-CoA/propionyl-CoA carboxylase biotin carboxyl carrier protein